MADAWTTAAVMVASIAKELSGKERSELLELPTRSSVQRADTPAGFELTIEHLPMLNGGSTVWVEAARPYLFGLWWRSVVSAFEVSYEGIVTHFPQRVATQSGRERKRKAAWVT